MLKIGLFISALYWVHLTRADEVLGCGGYIKSDVEVDFSQVGIKLLTQELNLKYDTGCAPNNGYYFIPLYDKGDYILQVSPPNGWSFEPEQISIKIDGETDPCSQNKDINFYFKGFAVIGKVISQGSSSGPDGVTVDLCKKGGKTLISVVTSDGGNYMFTPLAAGEYEVVASHPRWNFLNNKVFVKVTDKNGDAGSNIVVGGYSISGSISAEGAAMNGMSFVLHGNMMPQSAGCKLGSPKGFKPPDSLRVLCHVESDVKGVFTFGHVAPGTYTIVVSLTTSTTTYGISPNQVVVEVGHGDVVVEQRFKIEGVSLSGMVLAGPKQKEGTGVVGVVGAEVLLDGKQSTQTDANGIYRFNGVSPSTRHTVDVVADGLEFLPHEFDLDVFFPQVADLSPIKYRTCIAVSGESSFVEDNTWTVDIIPNQGSSVQVQLPPASKNTCTLLPLGSYTASVRVDRDAENAGVRFGPEEHKFVVDSSPLPILTFSQFLGEVSGILHCLESCPPMSVSLRPSKSGIGTPRVSTASQGKFVFADVTPGFYELTVDKEEWCWKEQTQEVSVNAQNVNVKVVQTGFRLSFDASHDTTLKYKTSSGVSDTIEVNRGVTRQCVSAPGKYTFTPISCHKFDSSSLTWETTAPKLISLIATHHKFTGRIEATEPGPFSIKIKFRSNPEETHGPLVPAKDNPKVFPFDFWAAEGDSVMITPLSSSNLFQYLPANVEFMMPDNCHFDAAIFQAERALFVKGYIKPAVKGVTIYVKSDSEILTFTTNSDGLYIAGPLDKTKEYTVVAESVGYTMKPPSYPVNTEHANNLEVVKLNFEAYKLAEIIVKVTGEENEPLKGVLISTSGGKNYRQNSLTEVDGVISFQSLMPSEYYLKPMMKEYTFNPPSKMVDMKEGSTVHVSIRGTRVSYSVYGNCVSLTGESEADVVVEAVGVGEACLQLQEEAVADLQGQFRIRGLMPKCEYVMRLKQSSGVNTHVQRALPAERSIQVAESDVRNIRLVVLRPFLEMDVAVIVNTSQKFLSSLTIEVYRENPTSADQDTPLVSVPVGSHPFVLLPPMRSDGNTYSLHLVSNLLRGEYVVPSPLPSVTFVADSPFRKLELSFHPTLQNDEAEMRPGTAAGLCFIILVVIVVLNHNRLEPLIAWGMQLMLSSRQQRPIPQPIMEPTPYIEPIIKRKVKFRKT